MSAPCTQNEKINKINIAMAKLETKLDATAETAGRIEDKLDKSIEAQGKRIDDLGNNFSSTMIAFADDIREQLKQHAENTNASLEKKAAENRKEFAGKWLEKTVVRAVWIILTPILGSVGWFIYKVLTSPALNK